MDWEKVAERICTFITERCKDKNAVVGMSGGIDSTMVAVLTRMALGKERVRGLIMPNGGLGDDPNSKDALELADMIEIDKDIINIHEFVDNFTFAIGMADKVVVGNAMARIRMMLLYAHANAWNGLVVGTTNKSEYWTGYYTKYGDGGVDIEPIVDIYKTDLREFARYIGVDEKIITKPPTAGLWEGQTDEEELGISLSLIHI